MKLHVSRWLGPVVIGFFMAGCGGGQPASTSTAPAAPKVATSAERVAWYQNCWSLFNTKSWDTFKGCYADDVESVQKDVTMLTAKNPAEVLTAVQQFTTGFPDVTGSPQLILTSGDTVFGMYLIAGTNTGPMKGLDGKEAAPTNKKVGYLVGHVVQGNAAGDKAIKESMYQDNGTVMAQLGANPAPGRPLMTAGVASPVIVAATGSDTERMNAATFRAQADLFNKHDLAGTSSYNAPDAVFHDMTQPADMDAKANAAMVKGFFTAFPDATLTLPTVWSAGDYVVAEGVFTGTNNAAYLPMGIRKATKKAVSVPFVEVTKFEGGKVKEDWLFFDSMVFASQLGLLTVP